MTVKPDAVARLTREETADIMAARRAFDDAARAAERALLRAKVAVMDAEEAFTAAYTPILAAHGLDPRGAWHIADDGSVTEETAS